MQRTHKIVLYSLLVLLFVLHNDFWLWDNPQIVLGIPVGLLYHIVYCFVATILMAIIVKYTFENVK